MLASLTASLFTKGRELASRHFNTSPARLGHSLTSSTDDIVDWYHNEPVSEAEAKFAGKMICVQHHTDSGQGYANQLAESEGVFDSIVAKSTVTLITPTGPKSVLALRIEAL